MVVVVIEFPEGEERAGRTVSDWVRGSERAFVVECNGGGVSMSGPRSSWRSRSGKVWATLGS